MIKKISFHKYQKIDALNASSLKTAIKSPAHFQAEQNKKQDRKAAFDFGTAAHILFLEPDKFKDSVVMRRGQRPKLPELTEPIIRTPDDMPTRRSRGFQAFKKENPEATILTHKEWDWYHAQKSGKAILSESEYQDLINMSDVMQSESYTTAFGLLNDPDGQAELSFIWEDPDYGIPCKARFDLWIPSLRIIIDYKTTENASLQDFKRQAIWKWHYDMQAAWYCQGAEVETGEKHRFIFIVQEKIEPYGVSVLEISEETLDWGRKKIDMILPELVQAQETGFYPGYPDMIQSF